jgi:hypothetical protein
MRIEGTYITTKTATEDKFPRQKFKNLMMTILVETCSDAILNFYS